MYISNDLASYRVPLSAADRSLLGVDGAAEASRVLAFLDGKPTPLVELQGLAAEAGVGAIFIKDEGQRLGLGSFKALGGAYAVLQLVRQEAVRQAGSLVSLVDLNFPNVSALTSRMVFACATDGNHGKSVALGARLTGARSVIFVHEGVSPARVDAIARFDAEIVRVAGTYDDSVREAARVSAERGWIVVSDTSWPGYEQVPGLVIQGYTVMVREALEAMAKPPTHVFMQAGVGGLAAAVAGHLAIVLGDRRPKFVVVEPDRADCIFQSVKARRRVRMEHQASTVMAMLECYEPSLIAWRILSKVADGFMTIEDSAAVAMMNRLAGPGPADKAMVAGESGGAGLAGLMKACANPEIRTRLGLGSSSSIFLVNSEGATDPDLYRNLVGLDPVSVRDSATVNTEVGKSS